MLRVFSNETNVRPTDRVISHELRAYRNKQTKQPMKWFIVTCTRLKSYKYIYFHFSIFRLLGEDCVKIDGSLASNIVEEKILLEVLQKIKKI